MRRSGSKSTSSRYRFADFAFKMDDRSAKQPALQNGTTAKTPLIESVILIIDAPSCCRASLCGVSVFSFSTASLHPSTAHT